MLFYYFSNSVLKDLSNQKKPTYVRLLGAHSNSWIIPDTWALGKPKEAMLPRKNKI